MLFDCALSITIYKQLRVIIKISANENKNK